MKKYNNRILTWLIYIVIIIITLEVAPYIISHPILGYSFSRQELKEQLKASETGNSKGEIEEGQQNEYLGDHILHPYLGFVSIPHPNYNEFNFPGIDPLTKKHDELVNICLMGGSVAKDLYSYSGEQIISNLKKSSKFKNKKINLVVFALGGFKQPQQLMALNYFMSLGAEYDIVINLDGFNEIVLPYSDNLPFHVFPSYPRHWNIYSRKKLDSKVTLQLGKQAVIKKEIDTRRKSMAKSIFKYSNFGLFVWKVLDNTNQNELLISEEELRKHVENAESDYQATGIYTSISDTLAFFQEQAEFWKRSSLQIDHLSESAGFQYFHFLQPNQYVDGSKKLTEKELDIAFEQGPFTYKYAAKKGYGFLQSEGIKLSQFGVNFVDLTMMFKNENRTVYNDKCCHFNQLGYNLIADKITLTLLSEVEK